MNILIANDDGIGTKGLYKLVETLSQAADIYVCAPHTQRSASSHSITIVDPISVKEVEFDNAKIAFEITGTPVDCVKLGIKLLEARGVDIDMVFSGINHGGNLGTDAFYSGTVAAAREGCLCQKPSVAVSVDSHYPTHFEMACELALSVLQTVSGKLSHNTMLNVNVPDLPKSEVKGVKYTRLGNREYDETFKPIKTGGGVVQYTYTGNPVVYEGLSNEIDVIAMQEGYATITPLHYDLTDYELLEEIKNWRIYV